MSSGSYLYTKEKLSSKLATKSQSDEIIKTVLTSVGKNKKILDIGCGDGTYTIELFKKTKPKKIVGFDYAKQAVASAQKKVKKTDKTKLIFLYCNIYNLDRNFQQGNFDVAVIRGVLHHLYRPQKAIAKIAKIVDKVIVLEPNGYNPLLKIIEKTSSYHRQHEEKSYLPMKLNAWFRKNGFVLKKQRFFVIVPYFCGDTLAKFLYAVQPFFEKIPFFSKMYCGSVLLYYEKNVDLTILP